MIVATAVLVVLMLLALHFLLKGLSELAGAVLIASGVGFALFFGIQKTSNAIDTQTGVIVVILVALFLLGAVIMERGDPKPQPVR